MIAFTNPAFLLHDTGQHPEHIMRMHAFGDIPVFDPDYDALALASKVHHKNYIREVREACAYVQSYLDGDTIVGPGSMQAAIAGVNATMLAAERGDFAIVRPPGHHAYPDHASGFCLFNNIGIATSHYRSQGKRVAILDFDGHLGDGTSHIFYEDDQVLFISLHQYPAFPGKGTADEIGNARGKGFTINVPLPPHSGDDIFLHGLKTFLPVVTQFKPDMIGLSAGFDAHQNDPLLQLNLSYDAFHKVGSAVRDQNIPSFAVLEGGYNLQELPKCAASFLAGYNGRPSPYKQAASASSRRCWEAYDINVHTSIGLLREYWRF
ncbi:MAG: histone deacetylase [Saprospiraceae bacterium]|nr:histone deacetylase [Saprospiraceae bacterium]